MATNKRTSRVSKLIETTSPVVTEEKIEDNQKGSARDILAKVESGELVDDTEEIIADSNMVINNPIDNKNNKQQKVYDQHDLILCRNVSASWLKLIGKSGISYVWNATGDVCEVEYGDLWAKKAARAESLYKPYIVIEDDELLEQPRWKDLKQFYEEKVYGLDNIDQIISVPASSLEAVLNEISDGMRKAVAVRASVMVEEGLLDSIKKIKIIDKVCGTDLVSVIPD